MDKSMLFEMTMRLMFGDKAYHCASAEADPAGRRHWLKRCFKNMLHKIDELDTTDRHKSMLMMEIERCLVHTRTTETRPWPLFYQLLRLTLRLLGYDFARGARCHSPVYYQTPAQWDTAETLDMGDAQAGYRARKDAITLRTDVVRDLVEKGVDTFRIALVLRTSEYEVKRLRSCVSTVSSNV